MDTKAVWVWKGDDDEHSAMVDWCHDNNMSIKSIGLICEHHDDGTIETSKAGFYFHTKKDAQLFKDEWNGNWYEPSANH